MTLHVTARQSAAIDETPIFDRGFLPDFRLHAMIGTPSRRGTGLIGRVRKQRGTPANHGDQLGVSPFGVVSLPEFLIPAELGEVQKSTRGVEMSQRAVEAISDLARWLELSEAAVASLAGVSRRTLINWRSGRGAYGASSRYLFSLHTFVSHLVANVGTERARLWLDTVSDAGVSRLERLREGPEGLSEILRTAERLIFPVQGQSIRRESDEDEVDWGSERADAALMASSPRRPNLFDAPARRVRRV